METKRVKIRIAVVVDSDGNYNAYGYGAEKEDMDECFAIAFEGLVGKNTIEHQYIIEAEINMPKLQIINGTATKQTED